MKASQPHSESGEPGNRAASLSSGGEADDLRRAALNLMEDAVLARRAMEELNAELRASESRLERDLAAAQRLQEFSSRLILQDDVSLLYDEILDAAMSIMGSDTASMQIVDESEDALRLLAWRGFGPEFGKTFALNPRDSKTSCSVARRLGQRVVVRDVETCEVMAGTPALEDLRTNGIRAMQSTPLFSRGGKLLGMISTHWRQPHDPSNQSLRLLDILARLAADIIERKHAETVLRESEQRYRTLTSVITDVPWTTDPQGAFVTEQPAWTRYTGQTWEESRGFGWLNALHPDDREQVTATWKRACDTLSLHESSGRIWHAPTKQYRHFVSRATPILNEQGLAREWVGSCTDVHEGVLAEQERLRMLKFDETVMLGMGEGLYTVDAQGAVTTINPAAERLLGWQRGELLGRNMHEVAHYKHRDGRPFPADQCAGLRVLRDGVMLTDHEDVFIRKDGTFFDVTYSSSPLREGNRIVGVVVVFRDTSQRIAMEREIREQAEKLADESRRKDEFLAMLSHELRNPLAPIRSAVHLLRIHERGTENRIQQQAREIIERQVGNLTKLVSDLLEVSRVVSGRIRLDQQTVDLNQVVQHATETVKPLIEQRKHELVVKLCDEPTWANVDATRIEEVLINLLNNAAKYTDEQGRIEVRCEHATEGNYALVRVRDNGVGISKELLPRIFDLFTQAERSLARSAGGLGIGLSLAQRLVDMHGGTIEAHSPPQSCPGGNGSEFIVKLPLTHAPEMLQAVEPGTPAPQRDGIRVLVVDDNIDQVTMLSGALRHAGYIVQSAHTGPEGLQVALQWRPDIVVLDIGLPGLDGYEIARHLRSNADTKSVRLIALTGYAKNSDIARAREAGFDAHLSKPLEFDELEKLLSRTDVHELIAE